MSNLTKRKENYKEFVKERVKLYSSQPDSKFQEDDVKYQAWLDFNGRSGDEMRHLVCTTANRGIKARAMLFEIIPWSFSNDPYHHSGVHSQESNPAFLNMLPEDLLVFAANLARESFLLGEDDTRRGDYEIVDWKDAVIALLAALPEDSEAALSLSESFFSAVLDFSNNDMLARTFRIFQDLLNNPTVSEKWKIMVDEKVRLVIDTVNPSRQAEGRDSTSLIAAEYIPTKEEREEVELPRIEVAYLHAITFGIEVYSPDFLASLVKYAMTLKTSRSKHDSTFYWNTMKICARFKDLSSSPKDMRFKDFCLEVLVFALNKIDKPYQINDTNAQADIPTIEWLKEAFGPEHAIYPQLDKLLTDYDIATKAALKKKEEKEKEDKELFDALI